MKVLDTAELARSRDRVRAKGSGGVSSAFEDAALAGAVLVLDNFNALLEVSCFLIGPLSSR